LLVAVSDVDIVRAAFAAFEHRDPDALIAVCRPDIVFQPVTAQIAAGGVPYRGHDGMRTYLEDVGRVWQELRPAPDTWYLRDGGVVVATGRVYAWGAGRVVDSPCGWLWRVEQGRLAYGQIFETAAAALAAAGIEPDAEPSAA
jgi:ketosteroid isomerase-like protein